MFASAPHTPSDSSSLLEATQRFRVLVVALTLGGLVLAGLVTLVQPQSPRAEARLTLSDPRGNTIFREGGSYQVETARYLADRADLATSTLVLERAAEAIDAEVGVEDLREQCEVRPVADSTTLVVACELGDEATSVAAVDAVATQFRAVSLQETTKKAEAALGAIAQERTKLQEDMASGALVPPGAGDALNNALAQSAASRLTQLQQRETEIRTTQALFADGVDFSDPARAIEGSGLVARGIRNGFVGTTLGFLAAVAVAWFRADRRPIVQRREEVVELLGLPQLGEITTPAAALDEVDLFSPPTPDFQILASNVGSVFERGVALFAAATPVVGYEEAVVRTALMSAKAGKRVLLVDGDATSRSVSRALGLGNRPGLADVVAGQCSPQSAIARISFGAAPGLSEAVLNLMGPGAANADLAALARTPRAREVVDALRADFDLVYVLAPPLLTSPTTTAVGRLVDGVVMTIERGVSTSTLTDARQQLDFLGCPGLGFVLVDA